MNGPMCVFFQLSCSFYVCLIWVNLEIPIFSSLANDLGTNFDFSSGKARS